MINKAQQIKNTQQGISNKYALCIVDVKNIGTRTFSYLIPQELKLEIQIGQAVLVPFGNRKNNIIGFVAGFSDYLEEGIKAKEIIKIIDKRAIFNIDYLKLLDRIANYYCCDINTVIQAAVPMKFLKENKQEKSQKFIKLKTKTGILPRRAHILEKLEQLGESPLIEFEKQAKTTRATILKLQEEGFVEIIEKQLYRNPLIVFNNIKKDRNKINILSL